jgi:ppGpp synthetase/RelA/SpoT-type nucleotidyltranferase
VSGTGRASAALALHARIQDVVDEVQVGLHPTEVSRFFNRSDLTHLTKSPESILDKIARAWEPDKGGAPPVSFDDFLDQMDDLARFRIVLNFLSDVDMARSKLEEPYKVTPEERLRLSSKQRALYDEFTLQNHCLKDLIMLGPEERFSGERCLKGLFWLRTDPRKKVEVQVQTMLQEAWDEKDHFLVYEPRRRGDKVELEHNIEIYAMSELLYVADRTFNRLLGIIRKVRSEGEGEA